MSKKQVAGYILDKRVGKGSYATVWKGRVEGANPEEAVAVKVISRQTVTETAQLRQEVEVLRRISHVNIVRFRDLKKSTAHFYLVLEYCAGGDLSQFLRERGRVGEEAARRFLTQIAAGLCVLHKENVLHRDLKPQNILLSDSSDNPVLKIADFGFARALQPQDMAATVCGSPLYMAPEILRHEPYDARADLWSVGAILYELLLGRPPFSGANPMQLLANIERNDRVSFEGVTVSSEGQDFLRALLMRIPKERLSTAEFMRHTYVHLASGPAAGDAAGRSGREAPALAPEPPQPPSAAPLPPASEWFMAAAPEQGSSNSRAGHASPSSGAASLAESPTASPLAGRTPEGSVKDGGGSFHLTCQVSSPGGGRGGSGAGDEPLDGGLLGAVPATASSRGATQAQAPTAARQGAAEGAEGRPPDGRSAAPPPQQHRPAKPAPGAPPKGPDEDYIVLTAQQHIAAFTRGRGPTPKAAASSFCGNLSRIANTLEQLAARLQEASPTEALALLLRGLGLLERALNVSLAEEETNEALRRSFLRMLAAAETVSKQVRLSSQMPCGVESLCPQARPNAVVLDFAVQQAREAAVALSKGHEVGGWEAPCHEKLTLALLLLDLLGTDADGEDVSAISSYTAPISRLLVQIEERMAARAAAAMAAPSLAAPGPALAAVPPPPPQLAGC